MGRYDKREHADDDNETKKKRNKSMHLNEAFSGERFAYMYASNKAARLE